MFNRAIARQRSPRRTSIDHDPLFGFHRSPTCASSRSRRSRRFLTPVSHPFVERLIGTIRREYLDQTFFWNATDLNRKLEEFRDYNNAARVHRGLAGVAPAKRAGAPCPAAAALAQCGWQQHCRCLFQNPIALDYDFATDTPPGITFGVIHPFGMWHENTISHSPREVEAR